MLPADGSEWDVYWMREALALAHQAESQGEVPVGAVLVSNNKLIGSGFNQPVSGSDPTAHAEIIAIRSAAKKAGNYRLPNSVMYVTIEPCTMCVGAMIHARISEVVFGAYEPRAGALCSQHQLGNHPAYNHRIAYRSGVLDHECSAVMTEFFRHKRKS